MSGFRNSLLASTLPCALLLAGISSIGAVTARAENTFADFFEQGKLLVDVRYRFEHVDQAGIANEADAHTLRARIGFLTGKVWDLQALVEAEGVFHLSDEFNDTVPNNPAYPIVADPEDIQFNRVQLEWSGLPQTVVTVGRQRINLDNQRFVGGVGFRQNEQTFDAARIANNSIENLTLTYIYVNQINRIFGEESVQGSFEGNTHLLHAGYDIKNWGKLSAYCYLIELEDAPQASSPSNKTLGVRFAGKHDLMEGLTGLYALEYATQNDYANNPFDYTVDYWAAEAGLASHGFKLLGGIESLEGNGTRSFQTPLATLHKFQGYADAFLVTPANGIVDKYVTLGYETKLTESGPISGVSAGITYHDFSAERGGSDLGSEMDYEVTAKIGDHWSAGVKYADYEGVPGVADRDKLWLTVEFNY